MRSFRSLARSVVPCATVLIGCAGETNISGGRESIGAGAGGTDAGAAAGGRSGRPSSPPHAIDGVAASAGSVAVGGAATGGHGGTVPSSPNDASAAGASGGVSDGGAPVCPIRVSGTDLTDADCYACIRVDQCESLVLPYQAQVTPEKCVELIKQTSSFWCVWYADGALVDRNTAFVSCKTSPGRVVCGGGI